MSDEENKMHKWNRFGVSFRIAKGTCLNKKYNICFATKTKPSTWKEMFFFCKKCV